MNVLALEDDELIHLVDYLGKLRIVDLTDESCVPLRKVYLQARMTLTARQDDLILETIE